MKGIIGAFLAVLLLASCAATPEGKSGVQEAQYFLATGRWDNTVIVIDLLKAIDPANDATDNAVVNRLRVTPDIDPTGTGKIEPASGQPIYITINQPAMRAYVTDHSGWATKEQTGSYETGWPTGASTLTSLGQHGVRGGIAVVDLNKALDPANWGTLGAVETIFDSEGFGPTGTAVSPDGKYLAMAHAEGDQSEDGGHEISIVDLSNYKIIHRIEQAFGPAAPYPAGTRVFTPDPRFGRFPNTNGITFSALGGGTLFTANGGTLDLSVISWPKALAKDSGAELARIPTQSGGFGIGSSPDGKYVVLASREDPRNELEGNTISVIDVEKALSDPANAEVNRILVGTDDPEVRSRAFAAAFTPDGKQIVVTCFRSNNVSVMNAAAAVSGRQVKPRHIALETPDGQPSRPRGIAFSADSSYVAITGAPTKGKPGSGVVWILDTRDWTVKGRVTGIGNETYMIGGFTGPAL